MQIWDVEKPKDDPLSSHIFSGFPSNISLPPLTPLHVSCTEPRKSRYLSSSVHNGFRFEGRGQNSVLWLLLEGVDIIDLEASTVQNISETLLCALLRAETAVD